MKRRSLAALVASAVMLLATSLPALAAEPTPADGREFGQHARHAAPAHSGMEGRMLGECISGLASQGTCPHHPHH
jgi:hypothetical protein